MQVGFCKPNQSAYIYKGQLNLTFIEIVYIEKLVPFKDKTLTSTYLTREFRSKQRTIIHVVATSIVQIKFRPHIHTWVWCGNKIFKRFLKLQARSYVTKSTVEESCMYLKFHEIKVVNTMYFNQQQNQSLFYCINFNFKSGFFKKILFNFICCCH